MLLVGSAEVPTPADPAHERGAIWYSATGATWTRVQADNPALNGTGQTVITSVCNFGVGWIAGGTRTSDGRGQPTVWFVGNHLGLRAAVLSLPRGHVSASVSPLEVAAHYVIAGGVIDGKPAIWVAPITAGSLGGWRVALAPPAPSLPGVRHVLVAAGPHEVMAVVSNGDASQEWVAAASM